MGTAVRAAGGGRKNRSGGQQKSSLTRIAPPDELYDENAIRIWKTQSKILVERGTLELEDAPILMAYCNAFALMLKAEEQILKEGITEATPTGGLKKHPAVTVRNDCVSQLTRLGSLLGLDPMSRTRALTAGKKGDEEEGNEFDGF